MKTMANHGTLKGVFLLAHFAETLLNVNRLTKTIGPIMNIRMNLAETANPDAPSIWLAAAMTWAVSCIPVPDHIPNAPGF